MVVWHTASVHVWSFTRCQFICFHPRVTSVFSRLFPRPVLLLVSSCLCSSCVLWFGLSSPVPLGFTLSYVWAFLWVTRTSFCCLPLVASLCNCGFQLGYLVFHPPCLCVCKLLNKPNSAQHICPPMDLHDRTYKSACCGALLHTSCQQMSKCSLNLLKNLELHVTGTCCAAWGET